MTPKKIRRPRDFTINRRVTAWIWPSTFTTPQEVFLADPPSNKLSPSEVRRLAAWLLKAADYIEQEQANA